MRRRIKRTYRDRAIAYKSIRFMDASSEREAEQAKGIFEKLAGWIKSKLADHPNLKKALVIVLKIQGIASGLSAGMYTTAAAVNAAKIIANRKNEELKGELKMAGLFGVVAPLLSAGMIALNGAFRWKLAKLIEEEKQESLERR